MAKMTVTARLLALLPHKQDSDLQLIFLILPPKDICYCLMCGGLGNIPHFSGQYLVEFKWISRQWRVFYPVPLNYL